MHLDLDAFFCSVEELLNPALRGKAFVVGGSPQGRGVVSSPSYPARKFGVRSAMPTSQALRLCPGLIVVPHRPDTYGRYSKRVMDVLREYTSTLQQISVDEAWFDMTGFERDPEALAREIQQRIKTNVLLPASIGIATSKLVSKMASGKAKPAGVLLIPDGGEAAFLAPMQVEELWGVGEATATRLHSLGLRSIGQLQQSPASMLRGIFGDHAESMLRRANGIDESAVHEDREVKSISEENTFARDVSEEDTLRDELMSQSDGIATRLRKQDLHARTVHIKLRWPDFTTITRQVTLAQPTQLGEDVFASAETLWRANWRHGQAVRLIGVGVSGLGEFQQLGMFDSDKREHQISLAKTVDGLRAQYGDAIVQRARLQRRKRNQP